MVSDYNKLSNSELNILLKEMENEYESLKIKVRDSLEKMENLDKKYVEIKNVLNKRTRGKV